MHTTKFKGMVPIWIKLYNSGIAIPEISKKYNVSSGDIYYIFHKRNIKIRRSGTIAENHPQWKGDGVGLNSLHRWVKIRLPKPKLCITCKIKPPLDLANISPVYNPDTYNRELKNWEWLCRGCHMKKDGRLFALSSSRKSL